MASSAERRPGLPGPTLGLVRPLLVTARHRRPRSGEPWGRLHATVEGSAETLCGMRSLTWPKFWELTFRPGTPDACRACSETLRRRTA